MAAIQLRKILTQNPKLIKGYHLLALIQMKNQEWNKARRILKKAAKIDKTNTTTLRFLREIDEQTGVTTRLEKKSKGRFLEGNRESIDRDRDTAVNTAPYKERSKASLFFTLAAGFAAGAAALWFLAVPAIRQGIYREANEQIINYSESLASQGAELSKVQGEVQRSDDTAEAAAKQIEEEKQKSQSYEALFNAYAAMQQEDMDSAALEIQKVYADVLSDSMKGIYTTICNNTGVTGIEDTSDGEGEYEPETGDGSSEAGADEEDTGMADGGEGSYEDGSDYSGEGDYE